MIKQFTIYCFLIICLLNLNAQQKLTSSISGTVKDSQTGKPLKDVNVFIAKTLIGTTTNSEGKFQLKNIPFGRYVLIFSHIAYQNGQEEISLQKQYNYIYDYVLDPEQFELPEISVQTLRENEWLDNYKIFRTSLLGYGEFADSCEILNPFYIEFSENDAGNLIAECSQPLEILNNALGYKILYFLKYFEKGFSEVKFSGLPVFSELQPGDEIQENIWKQNRIKAYAGSLRHFLRSIADTYENIQLGKDSTRFIIDFEDKTEDGYKFEYDSTISFVKHGFKAYNQSSPPQSGFKHFIIDPFHVDLAVFRSPIANELYLVTDKFIQVRYDRELDEKISSQFWPSNIQQSWIKLHSDSVSFDKYGRYFDEFMIETFGYWAKERLSDMLPLEFTLPNSLLVNYNNNSKR